MAERCGYTWAEDVNRDHEPEQAHRCLKVEAHEWEHLCTCGQWVDQQ